MDKEKLLEEVAEILESQELAIERHPSETARVYREGRDAYIVGQGRVDEEDWMRAAGLSLEEVTLLHRYMLSSSFVSAWYHLKGEKGQRNKAAQSYALIVSSLGLDSDGVVLRYIEYERLWRRAMKAEGIAPFQLSRLVVLLVLVLAVLLFVVILA